MTESAIVAPAEPRVEGTPLVAVTDLRVGFPAAGVEAVRGVSLAISPGECVAIVGESGSGKSVTARSLLGLAGPGSRVTASRFEIEGRDALRFTGRDWRGVRGRFAGLVVQDALVSLDPLRTVGAEIGEVLAVHDVVPRAGRAARVRELLEAVGVPEPLLRARQYPHQLSGGLRQRALIASAIAADPALIIADEPTTALDVTVQAQVLRLLAARKAAGAALLLISHDLAVVASVADRILVMKDGVIVEEGPAERVLSEPSHAYTQLLLAAVPSAASRGTRLSGPARSGPPATDPPQPADGPPPTNVPMSANGSPPVKGPLSDEGLSSAKEPPSANGSSLANGSSPVKGPLSDEGLSSAKEPPSADGSPSVKGPPFIKESPSAEGAPFADAAIVSDDVVGIAPEAAVPRAVVEPGSHVLATAPAVMRQVDGQAAVLEVVGLSAAYGPRKVVDEVSFSLRAGETLGLVGESGSGKTTVARLVLGLLAPSHGEVLLYGRPWSGVRERERRSRRSRIQLISQNPLDSFDPRYTVGRLIAEPLRGLPRRDREARVAELLERVGLAAGLASRRPRELSGGQRQRVAIARALGPRPDVLVCDEPVSALDVSVQAQVLDLLADIQAAEGTALLFISHDLGVVHHLSDRVLVMKDGRVVEEGDVDEVFHRPRHPYTVELVAAIPRLTPA
ncbi:ABC transporter ATP-binding protein [Thermopolyspora sp. NPDC052614]|uniref:ABC transporter ATP-binding protein n=1 Tax=Thermopolyspora sp. NPDC052614 TaxID=3155682 RepID=UPI0034497DA0